MIYAKEVNSVERNRVLQDHECGPLKCKVQSLLSTPFSHVRIGDLSSLVVTTVSLFCPLTQEFSLVTSEPLVFPYLAVLVESWVGEDFTSFPNAISYSSEI